MTPLPRHARAAAGFGLLVTVACDAAKPDADGAPSPALPLQILSPRCYGAAYDSLAGAVELDLLPAHLALLPGADSGEVRSAPSPADTMGFWRMFMVPGTAHWSRGKGDSLDLSFSNGFSGITMAIRADSARLAGVVTFHYDVITDDPLPQATLQAIAEPCPR